MTTVVDGVRAIWQISANILELFQDGMADAWPDIKRQLATFAWIYVSVMRILFYICLTPLMIIMEVFRPIVWLLESAIAMADTMLARVG